MRALAVILLTGMLSACGALYTSPKVVSGASDAGNVQIAPITLASVSLANQSPYQPRPLPAVFKERLSRSGMIAGAADAPDLSFDRESRPAAIATRLPPPFEPGPYKIGVGDVVLLSTPSSGSTVEELSGLLAAQNRRQGYTVQDDGAIAIPEIGRVVLAGLTMDAAEAAIFDALVAKQIDPAFSVEIAEFNSQRVNIGGAVKTATSVPITLKRLRLSDVVTAAGGIAATDPDYATIRLYRDGTLYQIPVNQYREKASIQKLFLKDGDSIFVDTEFDLAKAEGYFEQQIKVAEYRQSARQSALTQLQLEVNTRRLELDDERQNFMDKLELDAVERDFVYIAGEVGAQNRYPLPFERRATLADALYATSKGVPIETGNFSELYVLRATADGTGVTAWHLDAGNAANLVLATQFEMRPNDVVFVGDQPLTAIKGILGIATTGSVINRNTQ